MPDFIEEFNEICVTEVLTVFNSFGVRSDSALQMSIRLEIWRLTLVSLCRGIRVGRMNVRVTQLCYESFSSRVPRFNIRLCLRHLMSMSPVKPEWAYSQRRTGPWCSRRAGIVRKQRPQRWNSFVGPTGIRSTLICGEKDTANMMRRT